MKNDKIPKLIVSNPERPHIPGYGISEESEGMLDWVFVETQLQKSKNYWISTTKPNGNPHSRPIWGVWHNYILFIGGGRSTRSFRNLEVNPNIVASAESGSEVVIIEGQVNEYNYPNLNQILGKKYKEKYDLFHPPPFWGIIPQTVFAWTMEDYSSTPTKWTLSKSL